MHGKYYTKTVLIEETTNGETAYADADLLFDWQRFDIPRGAACLKSIQLVMKGTNGADANKHDIELFFAKSIDGVAPSSLGTQNDTPSQSSSAACRRNIIGFKYLDASERSDDQDLLNYNVWGSGITTAASTDVSDLILEGESTTLFSTRSDAAGKQSIWIAGIAKGAFDFGTAVALNQGSGQAVTTTSTQLTTDGTDPRIVFQKGDVVQAQDNAVIGTVVSVDSATTMTVDEVGAALTNNDTINWKYPIEFIFGFEF